MTHMKHTDHCWFPLSIGVVIPADNHRVTQTSTPNIVLFLYIQ